MFWFNDDEERKTLQKRHKRQKVIVMRSSIAPQQIIKLLRKQ